MEDTGEGREWMLNFSVRTLGAKQVKNRQAGRQAGRHCIGLDARNGLVTQSDLAWL